MTTSQALKQPIPRFYFILNTQYSASSSAGEHEPTPRKTADVYRKARQAKLMLQKEENIDKAELADLIDRLERFGIAADEDQVLERETMQKWKQNSKVKAANKAEKAAKAPQKQQRAARRVVFELFDKEEVSDDDWGLRHGTRRHLSCQYPLP